MLWEEELSEPAAVPRNMLAKANELRDWHIYADLGQVLINKVRPLYSDDPDRSTHNSIW